MNRILNAKAVIVILILTVIPSLFLMLRNCKNLEFNYIMPKDEQAIFGRICGVLYDHGACKYEICNSTTGIYFFYDSEFKNTENEISKFVILQETRVFKKSGSNIVKFINSDDTLKIEYSVNSDNGVLHNGKILN